MHPMSSQPATVTNVEPAAGVDAPSMHGAGAGWVGRLRRFARGPVPVSSCDLCGAPGGDPHPHLVEIAEARLVCCCRACALLFGERESARYRRVPERIVALDGFAFDDAQWEALAIPVDVAFFYKSTKEGRVVAGYPGPAGATRSLLELAAWQDLIDANPPLAEFAPDVEALLVRRAGGARECFRVPIDQCYALVGLLRRHWRGVSGGESAWQTLDDFFARLARGEPGTGAARHA